MNPLIGAAAISGAAGIFQGSQNRRAIEAANKEQREFATYMYAREQADNIKFWNMQNAYNDPSAQMQRLRDAGLNPNLVYGSGTNATAGPISTASAPSFRPTPATTSGVAEAVSGVLGSIYDIEQKKANIAQTQAQTKALLAQTSNREFLNQLNTPEYMTAMQTYEKEKRYNELSMQRGSLDIQNLDRIRKEEDLKVIQAIGKDRISMYKQELTKAALQNDGMRLDNALKSLEADLAKKGIYRGDPLWMRVIGRLLSDTLGVESLSF